MKKRKWKNRNLPSAITIEPWPDGYVTLRKKINGKPFKKRFGIVSRESLDRAERKLNELEGKLWRGDTDSPTVQQPILFLDAAAIFLEKHGASRSRGYKYHFVALKEYFGKYYFHQLNHDLVGGEDGKQGFRSFRLAQGVGHATANRDLSVLSRMYTKFLEWKILKKEWAIRLKLPEINPTKFVWRYIEDPNRRRRILSREELACVAQFSTPRLLRIIISTLATVLRKADVLSLNPEKFIETFKKIQGIQSKTGNPFNLPYTKTMKYILETAEGDQILDETNMKREWYQMVAAVKNDYHKRGLKIEDFQFRDLRRTALRAVYDEDERHDIIKCRDIAGHKKSSTTELYLGVQGEKLHEAGLVLDKKTSPLLAILEAKSENQSAQRMPKEPSVKLAKIHQKSLV